MSLKLGDMLLGEGLVTQAQLDEALKCHVIFGIKLGSSLIELGFVDEDTLVRLLSAKLGVPAVSNRDLLEVPDEVLRMISAAVAEKYRVVPLRYDGRRLAVAMTDPSDIKLLDELAFITGCIIQPYIAPDVQIVFALEHYYKIKRDHRYLRASGEFQKRRGWLPGKDQVARDNGDGGLLHVEIPQAFSFAEDRSEETAQAAERYTVDRLSMEFARARHRDDVADTFVKYLGQNFRRGALFTIRGNSLAGWRAVAGGRRIKEFERISVELTLQSPFRNILFEPFYYQGPVERTMENADLVESLQLEAGDRVLCLPLVMMDRVVAMILVSAESESLAQRLPEVQRLVEKASLAFQILVLKDKLLQT